MGTRCCVGCDKRSAVAPRRRAAWCDSASLVTPYALYPLPSRLQLSLGDLQRAQKTHRLVHGLFAFGLGNAVGDDAGAGLDVRGLPLQHQSPQSDARIHVAAEVDVADRAAVWPAAVRFQLV